MDPESEGGQRKKELCLAKRFNAVAEAHLAIAKQQISTLIAAANVPFFAPPHPFLFSRNANEPLQVKQERVMDCRMRCNDRLLRGIIAALICV